MKFKAEIEIIGINPFVRVPEEILEKLFIQAGKLKGPLPICGILNKQEYRQTLVKFLGIYRLYINTKMLKNSPSRIGETISITVRFDPGSRELPLHKGFRKELKKYPEALKKFKALPGYRQREINRYILNLKSEESVHRNISRAIRFLLGTENFAGRAPE